MDQQQREQLLTVHLEGQTIEYFVRLCYEDIYVSISASMTCIAKKDL